MVSGSEAALPKAFGPTGGAGWLCKPGVSVQVGKMGGTNILIPSSTINSLDNLKEVLFAVVQSTVNSHC